MFFYLPSKRSKHNLKCARLALLNRPDFFEQIAKWIEDKWGYIRHFPGMAFRRESLAGLAEHMYVLTYAEKLVGCFALIDRETTPEQIRHGIHAKELMFVYLDETFRGLGIGKEMIETAKKLCVQQGANMLVLDTLNPNLNHFYESCGATVVCDSLFTVKHNGELLVHPSTLMKIDLPRP